MKEIWRDMPLDAVIMAGGWHKWRGVRLVRKSLIKLRGKPLFIHVLLALSNVPRFRRIYVVGPKMELENEIQKADVRSEKEITVIQEGETIVRNVFLAFDHSAGITKLSDRSNSALFERPIFVIGADSPVLLPEEVEQFLEKCDLEKYDYFIGMTPDWVLSDFRTKGLKRGISLAYTQFAEEVLRINNMHLVKPLKVDKSDEFNEIYKIRHLKKFTNFIRLAAALYKRNLGFRDWIGWLKMYVAMWLRKARVTSAADYLRKDLTFARAEEVVSHLLGVRTKMIITTYGGSALDVDKPGNINVLEKRFDEWIALQKKLGGKRPRI